MPRSSLVNSFNEQAEPLLTQANTLHFQNRKFHSARDLLLPRFMSGEIGI